MQKLSEEVERISGYVGLCMNAAKCKIMVSDCSEGRGCRNRSGRGLLLPGSHISNNGNCDKECSTRIGKASSVFGRLTNIWRNNYWYKSDDKSQDYESLVLSQHYCIAQTYGHCLSHR